MTRRTWIFVLLGAILLSTAALLYEQTLVFYGACGSNGDTVCTAPRTRVLGVRLSQTEAVVWSILVGATLGAALGVLIARVRRRTWTFVLAGALLIGTVGFVYAIVFDPLCMCTGIEAPCRCTHDEIFGWQPGWLAVPVWTAIGTVSGGILGLIAARVTRQE